MNILYINHYAGSVNMGREFRPYYLSKEWVKLGHTVTIIAGDYSHLRRINPEVEYDFQTECIDGIDYVWIKTGKYTCNGLKRAFTMGKFVGKLLVYSKRIASEYQPDIVIASSTYPLDTFPARKIAKLSGAKYIHEVHDMWPATLYEVGGMSKRHPFVVAMQIAENYAYKHCDKCVALLAYSKNYMVEHGLRPEKFINVQNGIVEEEWINYEFIPKKHENFFELHKEDFIVGYFGGHALSNALDQALEIAKAFIHQEVIFVFVGDGVEKQRLIKRAQIEKIENAYFLPSIKKRAIPDLLRHFDCSFIVGLPSPLYRFGLCLNKMYDSMMAGIPIICGFDVPETLVSIYNCGIQCKPEKTNHIVEAVETLRSMSFDERKQLGQNGKDAILNHFTYDKLANHFIEAVCEEID